MTSRLDDIDIAILGILQQDGRISNTELAQRVGLTPPTVLRRVKLLEEQGYIRGYVALLEPLALGLTVTAFIFVETQAGCDLEALVADLGRLPGVQEVYRLIGEWCLLLKVRTASPQTLEDLVYRRLRSHPSVRRTQTTLATSAACETTALPLAVPPERALAEERVNG
ncbi:MAG TPA: Lrp/AsnC family transcriptional regulator [Roseiflexaceae bacterium]|nr:Lrp/AsnC family transcriptional regulator [Roseiflexaceae bacterium]